MADRCSSRSPFWDNPSSSTRDNVGRQSRKRDPSMEGSRLPTYRRSKSALSLTRSTLEGKQTTRGRSSSTSKNIKPNMLVNVPGSTQSSSSQRSTSRGASNKFHTPLNQQLSQRTSSSTSRITSNCKTSPWFKSDNKEAQAKEYKRIRELLTFTHCGVQLAKPVNLRDFVSILVHLFHVIEIECDLSFANYVTAVPNLMKLIGYTGNCTPSFLKTLNTMHNWPHVLSMLSYLCDLVEAQSGKNNELLIGYGISLAKEIFRNAAPNLIKSDADIENGLADCVSETFKIMNVDIEAICKAEENMVRLRRENELLEEQIMANGKELESEKEALKAHEEKIESDKVQMETLREQLQALEARRADSIKKKAVLEEELKNQKHSKQDLFQLEEKKRDLEETCSLKREISKQADSDWNDVFLKLSKVSGKLKAAAITVNGKLSALSVNKPELGKLSLPEEGFSTYKKETFELMIDERLKVLNSIHGDISDLKDQSRKLRVDYDKNLGIKKDLEFQMARLEATNSHKLEIKKKTIREFDEKLAVLERKLQENRAETRTLIDKINKKRKDNEKFTELSQKLDGKIVKLEGILEANTKKAHEALTTSLININKIFKDIEDNF